MNENGYVGEGVMTLVLMIIFFCNIYSRLGAHSFSEPVQTTTPVVPDHD
jgi:hypothetical protein